MNIVIDGKACSAERGEFILDIARRNGIYIPTLCHSDALPGQGNCRLCMVEIIEKGKCRTAASCIFPLTGEIEVVTNSPKIRDMRKMIITLLLAKAPHDEALLKLEEEFGSYGTERFNVDESEKCILCGLCVRACDEMGSSAISTVSRGITKKVSTPYDEPSSVCTGCGACAYVCPVGAINIKEEDGIRTIWNREFQLLKCPVCGEYFAAGEQLEYIRKKLGSGTDNLLCSSCRRKSEGEKLKEIYEGFKAL
jgi:NADH dehydrogenase/NADH:ubiquinone oxidoreductase subunit G